jgi:xylulokinase
MAIVLGIDVGTQSTKALVYDSASGKALARAQEAYDLVSGEDGTREQEAGWWTKAIVACLSRIDAAVKEKIEAIGVSGQQHGFVPVDVSGTPLRAVKLWCDTSTVKECQELTAAFGGEKKLLKGPGNLVLPGYTISKILWLKKNEAETYAKMAKILLPHDYVNFWLSGEYWMEYGDASGTGFLDVRKKAWDKGLLKAIDPKRDLAACLPPLKKAREIGGRLTEARAKELGLKPGIAISTGGGDNMMAAIGTGNVREGQVTLSLGTSGTLFACSSKPIVDPEGMLASFCSSTGDYLPLLCTMNCTVATEMTRELFELDVKAQDSIAAQAPAGSSGVTFLPFFNGERAPNLPKGRASVMGLTAGNTSRANIARAAMESAAFGLKLGLEALERQGFAPKELRVTGGGSASPLWRQIIADVFNLPVVFPEESESAGLGAALQALWCLGSSQGEAKDSSDLEAIVAEHVKLDPAKSAIPGKDVGAYKEAYARYLEYLGILSPLYR